LTPGFSQAVKEDLIEHTPVDSVELPQQLQEVYLEENPLADWRTCHFLEAANQRNSPTDFLAVYKKAVLAP
jgi:hypothetical protein